VFTLEKFAAKMPVKSLGQNLIGLPWAAQLFEKLYSDGWAYLAS